MSRTQEDTVIKFDMHHNLQSVLQLKLLRGGGGEDEGRVRGDPRERFVADRF